MLPQLTLDKLVHSAYDFCEQQNGLNHVELLGVTDGKAIGTYVEHRFQAYLQEHYTVKIGNSAMGIDLPGPDIMTDIKVTSVNQPQSSCPFKSARQKVFGLGYNLLLFVYDKCDQDNVCSLKFVHCAFIERSRTADYTLTRCINDMLEHGANKDDIVSLLQDRNIPGDEIELEKMASDIIANPPSIGVLTVSNALQWRLKYFRAIALNNSTPGVINYDWQES
ncbi:MAG: hypothetical protein ROM54_02770 [Anaerobiospirillum sp.]|nr:hypothetical protein [Anaerobiospirillum sp.]